MEPEKIESQVNTTKDLMEQVAKTFKDPVRNLSI